MEIKTNYMIVITPKMNVLQFPIIDKYYVPPSNPAFLARGTDLAAAKGLLVPTSRTANIDGASDTSDSSS